MNDYSQIDQKLADWIDNHRDEIIERTQEILRIPSIEGEASPGAPFGVETRRALDCALGVAEQYGLATKNLDGYAAHAEWRAPDVDGDAPIIGVLAHVDVVPEGDGWTHPPFGAEIHNGKIYARGAIDDKGPAMAGLFALLAVKECQVPLSSRVRVILGADEESGFGCVKHYFAREEMPATGFTPDAMFPIVYAEKGIADAVLTRPAPPEGERLHIVRLRGGLRPNMVPALAEAVLENAEAFWPPSQARLNAIVGITTEETPNGQLRVTAKGVSAHGSTPHEGVNAIALLCEALLQLDHQEDQVEVIQQIRDWGRDLEGGSLGIAGQDDVAGPLTSNLGLIEYGDGQVSLTFNIRYPVTWDTNALRSRLEPVVQEKGWSIEKLFDQPPLYVPLDDPLSQTLMSVYQAETGDRGKPLTMGGGTYARAMRKGVAFGPAFPESGKEGGPHQADECWPVDDLIRATKIYAKAIARLAQ